MIFQELDGDQRREIVNTQQRYAVWRRARAELDRFKGSMVWKAEKGAEYLLRSDYDKKTGLRRQRSLGPRAPATERSKAQFESGRQQARERFAEAERLLDRQASINRAVGIGRVPLTGARIIRALDAAGLLGKSIRIVGTNAIYAYEAMAGVFLESSLTTTEDIDLLFDARRRIRFASTGPISDRTLMALLKSVDRSFEHDKAAFRAINRSGYLVDFIKPLPEPPWAEEPEQLAGESDGDDDLTAAGIEGLRWLENAPLFEATAIDERGGPLSIAAPDPRAFAVHKLWLAKQPGREPLKRKRDKAQAEAVAELVARYLTHLPYDHEELTALPRELFDQAKPLFGPPGNAG
jgi:hypothetical protein